jgi:hypothetical protein
MEKATVPHSMRTGDGFVVIDFPLACDAIPAPYVRQARAPRPTCVD